MSAPLWTSDEIRAPLSGAVVPDNLGPVGGISIDTRTLRPGDLFFAIQGVASDGHEHVPAALAKGAAAAVVSAVRAGEVAGSLIAVPDVLEALGDLARAARTRSRGRIVAVTGSVGKTGTKEALRLVLSRFGATHAADASYNNHWGVPLTLARLPAADAFGVFEVGMNHPGEIVPLTAMVRPEVAIVTTVEPVHIAHFRSIAGIADAKGEIFSGLEAGGVAVVPADSPLLARLVAHAVASRSGRAITFGEDAGSDVRALRIATSSDASVVEADVLGHRIAYRIGMPGRHVALNSLAVLATVAALGLDVAAAAAAYAELSPPAGRGDRAELRAPDGGTFTLVDESFNANPASMRAALSTLALAAVPAGGRRIAVLAEMGELGETAPDAHRGLAEAVASSGAEIVFLGGPMMRELCDRLPSGLVRDFAERAPDLEAGVAAAIRAGDVVMVKGSKSTQVSRVAAGLRTRFRHEGIGSRCDVRKELIRPMVVFLSDLSGAFSPLNVFRYITFRTAGATATALIFVLWLGPATISSLRFRQGKGQPIRTDGPQTHILTKRGTPTMGGLMILAGFFVSTVLWADTRNLYVWVVVAVTLGFGAIGFWDDYLKVTRQSHAGFSGKGRLALEILIGIGAALAVAFIAPPGLSNKLSVPFLKDTLVDLSWFYIAFGAVVIAGAGNAVNLTDGLDGLAIVPVMIAAATFGFVAYLSGNAIFANYLQIRFVPGTGELAVLCGALLGSGLGFLWFNAPPAQVFMGDTGSLALGGLLGTVAVATKHEIVLAIVGGLFVAEALSVIVQVGYFKATGRRFFRMAPIHHHFEQLGWTEPQVVIRFWIVAALLALVGLSTLKLR